MLTAGDIAVCMRLPPEKIIEYLAKKEVFISWDCHDLWQEEHAGAKTIAKVVRLDILQDIYNALEKAAAEGKTGRWFRKELEPVLQAKGWWGRITEVNPDTGEEQEIQAGSPWRLDTIFRTNMSMVYSAGRWAEQVQNTDDRPYWLYGVTHQLGLSVKHKARDAILYRRVDKHGNLAAGFVKKRHANYVQKARVGAWTQVFVARPFLPVDASGKPQKGLEEKILALATDFLREAANGPG
ncbi:hypothetical protein ACQSGE_17475 [Salmonella enterica]|uniref:phage head morphogenesis protein n=1 Tax=Salmonella enterica TaxID=28901 RepID=UPI003D323239